MIVSAMTLPEIRQEVLAELPMIKNKMHGLLPKLRRESIKAGNKLMMRYISYKTKQHNTWLLRSTWNKKMCQFQPIVIFHDNIGLCVANLRSAESADQLDIYHTHFFQRYRERLNLAHLTSVELVKHFFENADDTIPLTITHNRYAREMTFHIRKNGVALGELREDEKIELIKTFLPFEMLKPCQLELVNLIRNNDLTDDNLPSGLEEMIRVHLEREGAEQIYESAIAA